MLHWLRERRRARLRQAPIPEDWLEYLERGVPHYASLTEREQAALRDDLRIFIAEKHWEGCDGLVLTDEMRVTIAGQACLLTLALPHDHYPNVLSVYIYPEGYRAKTRRRGPAGVVTEETVDRLGEAWEAGPVVLSWSDSMAGGEDEEDGHNVVIHEFAHKLDMLNGRADGVPRLHAKADYDRWAETMEREYRRLRSRRFAPYPRVLDEYGAEHPAEFFAVATEAFFERPVALRDHHAELYEVLRDYYRQDPAARIEAGDAG
jgi:MtfA peptidase